MSNGYFVPKQRLAGFMQNSGMNSQEGVYVYGLTDPDAAKFLPPPLELTDPEHPMCYLSILNIREPTFGPWYLEGALGLMARLGEHTGVYFLGLMLSGPGALMGAYTGREGSGLPKKLCESIVVERNGDWGHASITRNGFTLADVTLQIGQYNQPDMKMPQEGCEQVEGGFVAEGGCILHKYQIGEKGFTDLVATYYDSPNRYYSWEPATAQVKLGSSPDDPWGDLKFETVLGAAWSVCDNRVASQTTIHEYPDAEVPDVMQYLYTGRYDQSLLGAHTQRYETH